MRKLALVLSACMAMFLCACSGSSGESSAASASSDATISESSSVSASNNEPTQTNDGIVEFDNVKLVDDDVVTVELTQFYEKEVNWAGKDEPVMEKYLTLKVRNNSENDMIFNLNDAYVHDQGVSVVMQDGNVGPAAGKTSTYSYDIQYTASPDNKPLDSIDDLYTFEGNIQTYTKIDNQLSDERNTKFSLAEILGSGASVAPSSSAEAKTEEPDNASASADAASNSSASSDAKAKAAKPLNAGETVTTDDWEITYVGAELTNEVLPSDTSGYYYTSYEANSGTVVLNLMFDVKCLSSRSGSLSDALGKAAATYAGKYVYDTIDLYYDAGDKVRTANRLGIDPLQQLRIDYLIVNIPEEAATSSEPVTADIIVAGEQRSITVR